MLEDGRTDEDAWLKSRDTLPILMMEGRVAETGALEMRGLPASMRRLRR